MSGMQTGDHVQMTRVTTVDGTNVLINLGQPLRLYGLKGEEASTTVVTLKNNLATPGTVAVLAVGALSLDRTVDFKGVSFRTGMNISIAATGKNVLVFWAPL